MHLPNARLLSLMNPHRCARVPLASLRLASLLAQTIVRPLRPAAAPLPPGTDEREHSTVHEMRSAAYRSQRSSGKAPSAMAADTQPT